MWYSVFSNNDNGEGTTANNAGHDWRSSGTMTDSDSSSVVIVRRGGCTQYFSGSGESISLHAVRVVSVVIENRKDMKDMVHR
mmetsp:Transcript_35026/g.59463  ORF Transcript_35026/g.59463 Transcript_35026/m.59463 type:complete len:82 (-) Transcript_35026:44-289(-)